MYLLGCLLYSMLFLVFLNPWLPTQVGFDSLKSRNKSEHKLDHGHNGLEKNERGTKIF